MMVDQYNSQRRGLQQSVDMAFRHTAFNEFAAGIEEAHGWVHGIIGGGWNGKSAEGHMWPLEYSSYEPLFWLHHT